MHPNGQSVARPYYSITCLCQFFLIHLKLRRSLPPKRVLSLQYNPPTLFVDLHLPGLGYGIFLKMFLETLYEGNMDSMRCFASNSEGDSDSFQFCSVGIQSGQTRTMDKDRRWVMAKFLGNNPLTKIVIVLDSNSCQDREIVTQVAGSGALSNQAGSLCLFARSSSLRK